MSEHGPSLKTYVAIFVTLLVLTMVTYSAAFMDFGSHTMNIVVAMLIAITKATLVVLFFMHVKYNERLVWIFVAAGFAWLTLLIVGTMHDYWSRGWLG